MCYRYFAGGGVLSLQLRIEENRMRVRRIFRMTQPIQNPTMYARSAASCEIVRFPRGHRFVGINRAGVSQMARGVWGNGVLCMHTGVKAGQERGMVDR